MNIFKSENTLVNLREIFIKTKLVAYKKNIFGQWTIVGSLETPKSKINNLSTP